MEKALLIYNPNSGPRGIPGKLDYIIGRFLNHNILVQPFRLTSNENKLAELIKNGNYSMVIASGGDGTVNLAVNLMSQSLFSVPLGILPAGTCNDFARSIGIPSDLKKCVDIILAGNTMEVDLGLINESEYFLNTCAGGNLVDVSFSTSSDLKKNFGPLAYYFKALSEFASIKPVKLKITTDDEIIEQEFMFFLIVNGKQAAGFRNIIKEADLSDGYMDILLLSNCLHIDLPALFFKVLNNDFVNDSRVMWLRTKTCIIEGAAHLPISIDGEKGKGLPMNVRFLNKVLKVFTK